MNGSVALSSRIFCFSCFVFVWLYKVGGYFFVVFFEKKFFSQMEQNLIFFIQPPIDPIQDHDYESKIPFLCQISQFNNNDPSQNQIELNSKKSEPNLFCSSCNYTFKTKGNIKRHNEEYHGEKPKPVLKKRCDICSKNYLGNLSGHLQSTHGIDIETKHFTFENYEKFESFLKKIKEETGTNYSPRNVVRDSNRQVIYANYICSTRGKINKEKRKRVIPMNVNQTIKLGNVCPAHISASRNKLDGSYKAKWIPKHIGHDLVRKSMAINKKKIIENDVNNNND